MIKFRNFTTIIRLTWKGRHSKYCITCITCVNGEANANVNFEIAVTVHITNIVKQSSLAYRIKWWFFLQSKSDSSASNRT